MKGMIAAVIVAATGLGLGAVQYPQDWLPDGSPQARLTLAAQCLLAGAFWLLLSIGLLARHRFFTPEDIDGSGLTSGTEKAKVLQAVLQNTLEQTTLAALTYIAFAALAPAGYLGALPAAALLFWFGRHPNVDPFFTELTGITQADIDREGIAHADALEKFAAFAEGANFWSWGKDELTLLAISSYIEGLTPPIPAHRFGNAIGLILNAGTPVEDMGKMTSGRLAEYCGLETSDGRQHDALDDASRLP
eukprot:g21056.t1